MNTDKKELKRKQIQLPRCKTATRKAKKSARRAQQRHVRDCAKRSARAKRCLRETRIKNNPGCTKSS